MRRILEENKEIATCVNLCAMNVGRILKAFNKHPQASKEFVAISSSIGVSPRCDVRHSDLDIYFNHFSEYWIVAILKEVFIGKRVICTPYVPVRPLKNSENVLFLQVRDANEHEEEDTRDYKAPLKGEQFFFKWSSGSMKIYCPESTKGDAPMTIEKSNVRRLTDHKVMFRVDTSNARNDQMIVTFIMEQSTTKELLITMNLTGNI
nr:uncharacterized protein LOC129263377 [Lytechinus pictus]